MHQPSRVLIVTPHYPPGRLGGTELRTRKLAKGLTRGGSDAQVLCVESLSTGSSASCAITSDQYEDVRVHRLDLITPEGVPGFRLSFDHPLIESAIEKVIRNEKIDMLHLISGYLVTACAVRAAHRCDVPVVVTLTDYWFVCSRINLIRSTGAPCAGPTSALDCTRCLLGQSRRYRWPEKALPALADLAWRTLDRVEPLKERLALYRLVRQRTDLLIGLLNQADAVTTPTNSLRPRLVLAGAHDRFVLSRHSLDLDMVDYSKATPKSASAGLRFGYIGQIQSIKGIDLVIEAFRRLAGENLDISLDVWGDLHHHSDYSAELSAICRNLTNVRLRGRYEPRDLPAVMADIDVLIVPSRWPEIGPFVILEAFATRTPVIAANIGNMPELVEHGVNGLLFEPGDSADLRRQMKRVLLDRALYQRLIDGIPRVRSMGEELAEVSSLYSMVLDERKAHGGHVAS